jgi:outer membrane protein assembly factor BamB
VDKRTGENLLLSDGKYGVWPTKRHSSAVLHDGKIVTTSSGLVCFDPGNLEEALWYAKGPECATTPAVRGTTAVVSYLDSIAAYAIDKEARTLWQVSHEPALYHFGGARGNRNDDGTSRGNYSAPLIAGDKVIVCDTGGHVRCLRGADGSEVWRFDLGEPVVSAPTASGNTLFVCGYEGTVVALTW